MQWQDYELLSIAEAANFATETISDAMAGI